MNKRQKAKYRLLSIASQTSMFTIILVVLTLLGCKSNSVVTNEGAGNESQEGLAPLSTMLTRPGQSPIGNSFRTVEDMTFNENPKEENKVAVTGLKKLPSLREQMSEITENQQHIITTADSVLEQLKEIRSDIEVIKNTLDLSPDNSVKKETKKDKTKEKSVQQKKKLEDDIILPDEKIAPKKELKSKDAAPNEINKKKSEIPKEKNVSQESSPESQSVKTENKVDSAGGSNYRNALRLISRREYAQAIPYLQSAISKPDNAATKVNAQYWLGEAMFATGNYEQALSMFQNVLNQKNSSKLDDAMVMLGETYFRQGRKEDAIKTFNKLISTFPSSEFVPRARKRLQQL